MYDSLLEWDRHLRVRPAFAASYEMPNDRTYLFRLRQGVRFHDGSNLTAEDVIYSLECQQAPPLPGRKVSIGQVPELGTVEMIAKYCVKIVMRRADVSLPGYLAWGRYSAIVPAGIYDATDMKVHGVGTGPFRLVWYRPNEEIIYTRYPGFWREPGPCVDEIAMPIIPEEQLRITSLLRREIDGCTVSTATARALQRDDTFLVHRGLTAAHRELQFTITAEERRPWHDKRVRQAVNHAIDRDALIAEVYGGDAEYSGVVPPGYGDWPLSDEELRTLHQRFDVTRARDLLRRAGVREGFSLSLMVLADPIDARHCAEVVKHQLETLDIECRLEVLDSPSFFQRRDTGAFDMALTVRGVRGDISGFFTEFLPEAVSQNERFSGWAQPWEIVRDIRAGQSTPNAKRRELIYTRLQRSLLNECVHVPLCQPYKFQVTHRGVRDMYVSYTDFNPGLREVWLDAQP